MVFGPDCAVRDVPDAFVETTRRGVTGEDPQQKPVAAAVQGMRVRGVEEDAADAGSGAGGGDAQGVELPRGRRGAGHVLILDRAEVAEPFLDAAGVVEAVDVLEACEVRFGPGGEDAAADAFGLDRLSDSVPLKGSRSLLRCPSMVTFRAE
nr:hypothetical protein [Streptomyces misionensis]